MEEKSRKRSSFAAAVVVDFRTLWCVLEHRRCEYEQKRAWDSTEILKINYKYESGEWRQWIIIVWNENVQAQAALDYHSLPLRRGFCFASFAICADVIPQ